jgi:chloride channel 3/4/5
VVELTHLLFLLDDILDNTNYRGFPVVQDKESMQLIGYMGRTELKYLVTRARKVNKAHAATLCRFRSDSDDLEVLTDTVNDDGYIIRGSSEDVDFGPYVDQVKEKRQ